MQQIRDWQALHRDGSETMGTVTGTKAGKAPVLYYAFTVNGRSYVGRAYATEQRLHDLAVSGPLAIRYVPGNPAVNHPADWESAPVDSVWFLAPLPIILFGIMFLISLWLERRLVAEGVPARGVIRKCSYGSRSGYIAKYEFRTEEGRVLTKRVGVPGPLEVGSKIWVVYLRRHPWRNQPYPSHNYRVQRAGQI